MLSYAYHNLQQSNYDEIKTESFDNVQDLFAAILSKGMIAQLKQGLSREYIEKNDDLSTLRGKINIRESWNLKIREERRLSCSFDELSENHYMNQILKTTALCLIYDNDVQRRNKDALKKFLLFLSEVDTLTPSAIKWQNLRYNRSNASYRMLMNICYLVLHELLLTTKDGKQKLATFLDDQQMSRLYEKFILEYYKKHYPQYNPSSKRIKWDTEGATDYLPNMQSDIMLTDNASGKTLIIDAKYHGIIMQAQYNAEKLESNNLYQIFAYVKNEDKMQTGIVDGILLYARTDEEIVPNNDYKISGNRIGVRTLDLNMDFPSISKQLDMIVNEWTVPYSVAI
jgi:5-methylcytosine-specific restriction enzyme subunit McrC